MEEVKLLFKNMFSADFNANEFFHHGTAQQVTICSGDLTWVIEHIKKWGQEGLDASLSYIQNEEPIQKFRTERFNQAISELVEKKQKVIGDIDSMFYFYNDNGPFRQINKYEQ